MANQPRKRLLLHTCCAPCAAPSLERALSDDFDVTLYFSNSNIFPEDEFHKRLQETRRLAEIFNVLIEEDEYDHALWLERVKGLEHEPEKGSRCEVCFDYSLHRTSELCQRYELDCFATTLTLSPHKVSRIIFAIGSRYPNFESLDFKKRGGFQRSIELCRDYDIYRQNYCGCEFSLRDKNDNR
mgnify:CR=1 FL=1